MIDASTDVISVLVVDDEPLARQRLVMLLNGELGIDVVGECKNGLEALAAITTVRPDLVFLDVQMPDLDGIGVVEALPDDACPEIVFVTAHSDYLERAFELHAVDYLRKPYTNTRFTSALNAARRRVLGLRRPPPDSANLHGAARKPSPGAEVAASTSTASPRARYASVVTAVQSQRLDSRLAVQDRHTSTWHIILLEEVDWITADGAGQVAVHLGKESFGWRRTLTELEAELAHLGFLRVHRSHIVNGARIRSVKSLQKGEFALVLVGGAVIDSGRTYREVIEHFLQRSGGGGA